MRNTSTIALLSVNYIISHTSHNRVQQFSDTVQAQHIPTRSSGNQKIITD